MAIELQWTMQSSDINAVGQQLGYDWNKVCDEVSKCELYGTDGSGFTIVERDEHTSLSSEILVAIFAKIFADHPDAESMCILNDF